MEQELEVKPEKKSMHYFEFHPIHKPGITTHPAICWEKKKVLDVAKIRSKKSFMYISVIAGGPGSGKSTITRTDAAYCCPWFSVEYICFEVNGKGGFKEVSINCPEGSSIIMDESFKAFNAQGHATKEFQDLLNHLQILRQKRLFIFLCIPNWFSLNQNISLNLSSHLFVTYESRLGRRGKFLAFGRDTKRRLWVRGKRFMSYAAEKCDFVGRFYANKDMIIDEVEYDKRKLQHLKDQAQKSKDAPINDRNYIINKLKIEEGWKTAKLAGFFNLKPQTITGILRPYKEINKNED